MERNGSSQAHKSIKGHTLTRSLAVVGDDDGVLPKEGSSESADQDDLLPFIKETLNKNIKDRNLILRTEAELLQFINSQSQSLPLPGPYSSYQRLLIHRVAAYFLLEHNIDNSGSGIIISRGERSHLPEGQRVKFRDLLTNLSHEEAQKKQRKHTHSQNQAPPQWSLAQQQRILKVASFDEGRVQPPPHVAKAYSFGGYPRHHNSNAIHKTPNTLSAEASLSPASSGYKSTSFPSMELRTPSPAGPYFPTADEPNNGATQQQHHLPPATITPNSVSSQAQELVLWAVSDIKSVPPGALLIDPATLSPLRYAGQEEGQQQSYYQAIPPPPPPQAYYPPHPPPIPHQPTYNYYEHVGDIGHWLAGLSLNPQQQQYYAQHSHPPPPQQHPQHPGLYYPQPFSYYPQQSRLPHAAGVTGPPLRFYFPQPMNPPFLLPTPPPPPTQQFSPKNIFPPEYAQTTQQQSLPLQQQQQQRWSYNSQLMGADGNSRNQSHGQVPGMNRQQQPKHNNRHN